MCSQKKFALFLYLSKGIFKGCFASFAKDFNIWRYHLLPPLRKNFSLYLPIWKRNFAYKIGITPTHIKVTLKAFWWGDIANIPHLIATRMAFWGGTFSKIQSMFTNSLSPNSLEKKQNLRLRRNILIYYHKTATLRGYILKIYPSTYVKVNFGENLRRFTKNSSHLYKNYFQFTLDTLKNYFSHLIAVGNAKIKRGKQKFFSYNSRRDHAVY